ncbi:MAG: aminotransferase class V-fold PLP-dependent enzyme [Xanthomonadales bacterium]|nr:aminotransferase class V-fold PLP-dependent enzyme [Xanthomonadales bacterium]
MPLDLNAIRDEFPLLQSKIYLNNCSYGVLSRTVERAFHEYLRSRHVYGSHWEQWVTRLERLRGVLGELLQCVPADVSVSSSVSESVNSLAGSIVPSGSRDTVVVTDFDFPTTSQIWLAQQRRGVRIVRAPADESGLHIPLERFDELIDERTLLVSVPYVCYRNGVRLHLEPIIRLAHDRGALVLVDAYQALGSQPLSAPELGADFLVGGCLKYLLGTAGMAFMYVRDSEQFPISPTSTGWFAQEDVNAMDIYHNRPASSARRFESGTPNISGIYACTAGVELLLGYGLENVQRQVDHLTGRIAEGAATRGWPLITPVEDGCHGAMMALASTDAPALVRQLADDGIVVSDRDGNVRIAPHFYNNDDDIDSLLRSLEKNSQLL